MVLHGLSRPGVAAAGKIIRFRDTMELAEWRKASVTWFTFHGPQITANGWEPYDQPHPSAYVPFARRELERLELWNGVFYYQSAPYRESIVRQREDVRPPHLHRRYLPELLPRLPLDLATWLEAAGVAADHAMECAVAAIPAEVRAGTPSTPAGAA